MTTVNEFGQAIGDDVANWHGARRPEAVSIPGHFCTLERLDPGKHAHDLFAAYSAATDDADWTYLPCGPFTNSDAYHDWAKTAAKSDDPRHYAVLDNSTGRAVGTMSLLRHDPANGVIEVGYVIFSRLMQGTPISTEAQFLLMSYVFDTLGYRRYEWKCDDLNAPSRRAAERLGFTYEGTFRQAVVYKGRNRDTAWYAITDQDWLGIRAGFEQWLAADNFDPEGKQRTALQTK